MALKTGARPDRTRSSPRLETAWARCIVRAIRGSDVTLRSKYGPRHSQPTSIASIGSSRKRVRSRRFAIRT